MARVGAYLLLAGLADLGHAGVFGGEPSRRVAIFCVATSLELLASSWHTVKLVIDNHNLIYYSDANNAIRGAYALQPSRRRHRPRPFAHLLLPSSTPETGRTIITLCNAVHLGHPPTPCRTFPKQRRAVLKCKAKQSRRLACWSLVAKAHQRSFFSCCWVRPVVACRSGCCVSLA
jgi:hypothetical protein